MESSLSDPSMSSPGAGESVIVVMDANQSKGRADALDWTINSVVRPKDNVVVLGVLHGLCKKPSSSCFSFPMGIWVKLEFSGKQGEMSPNHLQEEIEKKREEYQCILQPYYRWCKKNEVNLVVRLGAGFDPRMITIEAAHKINPRWIVLDSQLKKDRVYIYGHVACNVAVLKGKGVATLMPSRTQCEVQRGQGSVKVSDVGSVVDGTKIDQVDHPSNIQVVKPGPPPPAPQSPCWYPLAWRSGFPRAFSLSELELVTNGFSNENIVAVSGERKVYEGIYLETPVIIKSLPGKDKQSWSLLKIMSRVRHRSIWSLVGYCCTNETMFLLCDYPCSLSIQTNFESHELAKHISWKIRWYIALDIGAGIRYLREECPDGPIVDLAVSSTYIAFFHGSSAMLSLYHRAKWLKDDIPGDKDSAARCHNMKKDECFYNDIRDYGVFLIELISGKSAENFQQQGQGTSLIDWALPLLESGSLSQVMDPRLTDTSDDGAVDHMRRAALICLRSDPSHDFSMSKVLAVVRGDQIRNEQLLNF